MAFFANYFLPYFVLSIPFIFVILILKYRFDNRKLFLLGSRLPGPKPWPIIGNGLAFLKKDMNALAEITRLNKTYEFLALWFGPELNIFISTPEDSEIYYKSPHLLDRSESYQFLEPAIGKGLLTANGRHWEKSKRSMEPGFQYSSLKSFLDIFQKRSDLLVQDLRKEEGKGTFSVCPYIKSCTFDTVLECITPLDVNAQQERLKVLEHADIIMNQICDRMFSVWQQFDFIFKLSKIGKDHFRRIDYVHKFADSKIKEMKRIMLNQKESPKGNNGRTSDKKTLLELMIENEEWDDVELREHTITTVVTGYETTSSVTCFLLIMLGIHKNVQEKLYNELMIGFKEGMNETDLHRLEYLRMVIKETLRLYPTAPLSFRKADKDFQMGKHLIPKGAAVAINIFALHRDPKQYENPEAFNPDNFLLENIKKRHSHSFLPFGAGTRKCIGYKFAMMSIGVIVSNIVRNYKIECDLKMDDIKVKYQMSLKMKNGLYPIRLIKRQI